jgi:hypothetical protein
LHSKKVWRSQAGEKNRYKIGLQGTTVEGEGAKVKLYVLEIFDCNMSNPPTVVIKLAKYGEQ